MGTTSPALAKRWIIVSLGLAGAASALDDLAEGRNVPQLRTAIGGLVAGVMLTLLAEAAPQLASGIALTILAGALLRRRGVIARISDLID